MKNKIENDKGLLNDSFIKALKLASNNVEKSEANEHLSSIFEGKVPSDIDLVKKSEEVYLKNQVVIDAAVKGAMELLSSPRGISQLKELETSIGKNYPDGMSQEMVASLFESEELSPVAKAAETSGLPGFSIGGGVEASALLSLGAGFDFVCNLNTNAWLGRLWGEIGVGADVVLAGGINLGFWQILPRIETSFITGWLTDLFLIPLGPTLGLPAVPFGVRFMVIYDYNNNDLLGYTVQVAYGKGVGFAKYWGVQYCFPIQLKNRLSMEVENTLTLTSTVLANNYNNILNVDLTNTSGFDIVLKAGDTISFVMPSYFTEGDVGQMSIDKSGWNFTTDGSKLILTVDTGYTWGGGAEDMISIVIKNIGTASTPIPGTDSAPGSIKVMMKVDSLIVGMVASNNLSLVWSIATANIDWEVNLIGTGTDYPLFVFTDNSAISGSEIATTKGSSSDITILATVQQINKDGSTVDWNLGYQFIINNLDTSNPIPLLNAVWWKNGTSPTNPKNLAVGAQVFPGGPDIQSVANYTGVPGFSPNEIVITVIAWG